MSRRLAVSFTSGFTSVLAMAGALSIAGCGGPSGGGGGGGGGGGSDDGGAQMMAAADMAMAQPDLAIRPYPAAPYGIEVGKRLAPIVSMGYNLSPTVTDLDSGLPFENIKLWDYIQARGCKCLMINKSAEWCAPCNTEQPDLIGAIETHPDMCIFSILLEGTTFGVAAKTSDLPDWIGKHHQNFPIVMPNYSALQKIPNTAGIPVNVVVETTNMEIVDIWGGYAQDGIERARGACGL